MRRLTPHEIETILPEPHRSTYLKPSHSQATFHQCRYCTTATVPAAEGGWRCLACGGSGQYEPASPPLGAEGVPPSVPAVPTGDGSCCPTCDMKSPVVFPPLLQADFAEHEPLATRIRRETATACLAAALGNNWSNITDHDGLASDCVAYADALLARLADTQEVPS